MNTIAIKLLVIDRLIFHLLVLVFVTVHGHFSPRRDFSQRTRSTQRFFKNISKSLCAFCVLCEKQKNFVLLCSFVVGNKTRKRILGFCACLILCSVWKNIL